LVIDNKCFFNLKPLDLNELNREASANADSITRALPRQKLRVSVRKNSPSRPGIDEGCMIHEMVNIYSELADWYQPVDIGGNEW
jgi:hypothetical protein